jgi:hypothetical protein
LESLEKSDYPVWETRVSGFSSFRTDKKEAKLKGLKIQWCFKHGKGRQGIKGPRQKKFKPEDEVAKIVHSSLKF